MSSLSLTEDPLPVFGVFPSLSDPLGLPYPCLLQYSVLNFLYYSCPSSVAIIRGQSDSQIKGETRLLIKLILIRMIKDKK